MTRAYSTQDLIEFVSEKRQHLYRRKSDQMPVPGVTSILQVISKPALIQWAANMASAHWLEQVAQRNGVLLTAEAETIDKEAKLAHRTFSKAAADIGTEVHKYAECKLKGLPVPELKTPQAIKGAEAFDRWRDDHDVQVGATERICFSQKYWYCGTCDFVGRIDGESCIADFKTSSGIWPEMRFQLAAYQQALEEEYGEKIKASWIVRFDKKTGEFEAKRFTEFDRDFHEGFVPALTLHRTLRKIKDGS